MIEITWRENVRVHGERMIESAWRENDRERMENRSGRREKELRSKDCRCLLHESRTAGVTCYGVLLSDT